WRKFLAFHRVRGPSRGAIWFYVFRTPTMAPWLRGHALASTLNAITVVLVAGAMLALIVLTARGRLDPIAACALATIAFLVGNKIYSPQYDLWLLPFLVMLPVRTRLFVHFVASSMLVFVLTAAAGAVVHGPLHLYAIGAAVVYRLVVLARIASGWSSMSAS